eukprot:scaffold184382_cov85-Cyclotella_meneghiniana.AAC.1
MQRPPECIGPVFVLSDAGEDASVTPNDSRKEDIGQTCAPQEQTREREEKKTLKLLVDRLGCVLVELH